MLSYPTWQVTKEVLEDLFRSLDLWAKIDDKRLRSEPAPGKRIAAHHYPDALSLIVKHFLSLDNQEIHVATTHQIADAQGNVLHRDAKDLLVGGVRFWRP